MLLLLFHPRKASVAATTVTGMYDEPTPGQVSGYDEGSPSQVSGYDDATPSQVTAFDPPTPS